MERCRSQVGSRIPNKLLVLGFAILLIIGNLIFNFDWSVPFGRGNLGASLSILAMVFTSIAMLLSERDDKKAAE